MLDLLHVPGQWIWRDCDRLPSFVLGWLTLKTTCGPGYSVRKVLGMAPGTEQASSRSNLVLGVWAR